jgi:hypothetical protein
MLMVRIPGMIRIKRLVQRRPSHQSSHVFRPDADPAERELVLSVMQKVFIYSPEERLTAT